MVRSGKSSTAAKQYLERIRERFYRILLEQNLKLTKPRKAIVDLLLKKRGWHFQADEMFQLLNDKAPGVISRATVYRTLELLVEAGILAKARVHQNSFRYELAEDEGHHHHLVDINTGKVVEFAGDKDLHRMLKRVFAEHSFEESYHVLEVFGTFSSTASKTSGPPAKSK